MAFDVIEERANGGRISDIRNDCTNSRRTLRGNLDNGFIQHLAPPTASRHPIPPQQDHGRRPCPHLSPRLLQGQLASSQARSSVIPPRLHADRHLSQARR